MSKIEDALKKAIKQRRVFSAEDETNVNTQKPLADSPIKSISKLPRFFGLLDIPPIKIDNLMIATVNEEKTPVVEEYNRLRSTVIALTKGESFLNTILITSTASEEGKSMTSLNLSISLAKEHDHTVLLVDADLRRPSIHKFLNLSPEVGLVQCIRDNVPLEQALIKTGIGKLVVLPAGEAITDPIDLLSSHRMKEIVQELKERYSERYVVFDTPPAMPFADAGVLAAYVDAVLFVVREGRAQREDLIKTLEEMKTHNLLGIVYNDAKGIINKSEYYY